MDLHEFGDMLAFGDTKFGGMNAEFGDMNEISGFHIVSPEFLVPGRRNDR